MATNFSMSENFTWSTCMDPVEYARVNLNDSSTNPAVQIGFGFVYIIIFILGVGGNTLVILSVYKHKSLHSVRNTFIVSLSCSDIAVCLTSVLTTPIYSMVKVWLFGEAMCHVIPLFQGMSICISTFTLSAIAIDRYILIIHPTKPPIRKHQAICMILAIWLLAASISIPIAVHSVHMYASEEIIKINDTLQVTPCGYYCMEQWTTLDNRQLYGTCVLMSTFVLPLMVIGFSYSAICVKLNKGMSSSAKPSVASSQHGAAVSDRQKAVLRRKQRTNRMLIAMVFIFALSWFLQVLINVLNDYKLTPQVIKDQPYSFGLLFHSIAMTSTCWNPILYAGMNEAYRSAFVELLPCLKLICKNVSRHTSGSYQQRRLLSNAADFDGPTALNSDEFARRLSPPNIAATNVTVFDKRSKVEKNGATPVAL